MINYTDKTYTFSHSNTLVHFINNIGKIGIAGVLFVALVTITKIESIIVQSRMTFVIIMFSLFILFMCEIYKKFAYKIDIDFASRKICLYMFRSNDVVTSSFDGIKNIRLNLFLILNLNDKKVFYMIRLPQDSEILRCLNKVIKIKWGLLSRSSIHCKRIRNELGRE